MEYLSPESSKLSNSGRVSEEIRFKTPKDKRQPYNRFSASPDFAPYNFSSPVKSDRRMNNNFRGGRNKRYFNISDPGGNSGSNYNSPFYNNRRGNGRNSYGRGGRNRNRHHGSEAPISAYIDSSMTEDPWLELEKELEKKEQSQPVPSNPQSFQPVPTT